METNSVTSSEMVLFPESILNENIKKRPKVYSKFWILSIISWILFIILGFSENIIYICKKNEDEYGIWSFIIINNNYKINEDLEDIFKIPIQMHNIIFILLLVITLIFAIFQFVYFLINSIFKNNNVYDSMMGPLSKFHFFPLFCYNAVLIIGLFPTFLSLDKNLKINILVLDIIISIFGLLSLIFIYKTTKFKYEVFYKVLIIKKGTYSCLLALMIYHIGYSIIVFEYLLPTSKSYIDKICIFISIIIGLLNLFLGLSLKDIILLFMNILINIGILIKKPNKTIQIINIIIIILFFLSAIFLIVRAIKK